MFSYFCIFKRKYNKKEEKLHKTVVLLKYNINFFRKVKVMVPLVLMWQCSAFFLHCIAVQSRVAQCSIVQCRVVTAVHCNSVHFNLSAMKIILLWGYFPHVQRDSVSLICNIFFKRKNITLNMTHPNQGRKASYSSSSTSLHLLD